MNRTMLFVALIAPLLIVLQHPDDLHAAGALNAWHDGRDPPGISIPDPARRACRLANYLALFTLEAQTTARACGKSHVHNLEPEALVALTVQAVIMARVPLASNGRVPGP